ncbi:CcoQ/FixQ family Cbb3-type cytochrome c oxidase assembly chaperone [Photobacterium profundum]|jgi:cytochrome c oxidase cbb3-type subunit IV|uniref:Cytochrome c oxidase, subunit CcoQ n=3 Tax=Photobacterium TaxID=657 RepID=Q6LR39_PHOPR|nr:MULTISPECIES: CcoQ/FixQ family Cbb3-type cytochrome c oxidase assembly chaperone [Photobacterium]EAS40458.1 putative cytochrome c oxidase, subunit CcoQ [Photobacterium profundum 3TCK]PSU45174.1 CcoQ/FixQ family Cbb3-type cytochrome c oxidase assembly chaperone [Photobacterium frigidiphilum]PSV59779.1 CcoQ/FixQ family Cbb3-type cytochrome c oxidase assembly chaperone [Photobacterium profundum]CAG20237.1 putative cytochrome c oxidase, subunit CcoQ [Photobacterium profundum SS9]
MDIITVHSVWTVVLFISFIGIILWAYSKRRKSEFSEAANLVFADEEQDLATREKDRS